MDNKPNLREVKLVREKIPSSSTYPFSLPIIKNLQNITFRERVCFFVGENGTGKSTLLEAIAECFGFGREGGSKNITFQTAEESDALQLSSCLRLSWGQKILGGYFFRAESFFTVANYIDSLAKDPLEGSKAYIPYGGKSLHKQSHGESFLSLFEHRFSSGGFFILDEPEAALSPQRQLDFLNILHTLMQKSNTQFIIATHSPILLAYPHAQIISFDGQHLEEIAYEETKPYKIVHSFLQNPSVFFSRK